MRGNRVNFIADNVPSVNLVYLCDSANLPSGYFDFNMFTQSLKYHTYHIYDIRSAYENRHRWVPILRPISFHFFRTGMTFEHEDEICRCPDWKLVGNQQWKNMWRHRRLGWEALGGCLAMGWIDGGCMYSTAPIT